MFWLKIGAKNIYRKGRNVILVLLIGLFGAFLITTKNSMTAFMESWENSIISQNGHIVIAPKERFIYSGFLSEQFFIEDPQGVVQKIKHTLGDDVKNIIQKLSVVGSIASSKRMSFAIFKGIDITTTYMKKAYKIEDLKNGAIVGYVLGEYLDVDDGDEVTIMANAIDGFPNAIGINIQKKVLFGERFADSSLVVLSIETLRNLINANVSSHISVYLRDKKLTRECAKKLRKILDESLEVKTWDEVVEEFKFMRAFLDLQLGVLNFFLTIIAFIVTLFFSLLAIRSDYKEIGTLRALGVPKKHILSLYTTECFLVATLGVLFSLLIGYVITISLNKIGIPFIPPGATITVYIRPNFDILSALDVVKNLFIFTFIGWFVAIIKALRISPVEAFRDV